MAKKKNNMLVDFIENFKKVLNTPEQSNQQTNTSTNQKSTFQLPTRSTWQSFQNDRQQRENVANNILSTNRNNSMATKSTAEMLNNNNFFSNLNNNFRNLPTSTKRENINAKGIQSVINAREQAKNLPVQEEKEQKEEQTTPKTNTIPINTNTGSMNMTPGQVGIQHKNAYGKQTDITKTPEYQQIKSSYNELQKKAESGDEEAKQVVEQANKLGLLKEENKSKIAEFINKKNQEGNLHVLSQEEIDQRKSEAKKRLSLGGIKNWNLDSVIDYITDFSKLSSDLHAIGAPDFVTKPLDAIAPAGATVKTYGHHVETGVSNAVNALEKDKKHLYEDTFLGDIVPEAYKNAQIESAEKITKTLDEYANQMDTKNAYNSSVANNNKVWGYFNDHFAPTLGEMTPSIIANMLVPETQVPATVTQFFVSKGSYYRDAEQRGMNPEEAMWYSNIMGFVEAGTEALTLKNAKKIGAGVKELTNGTLKKSVKDVGLKQTLKNLGGEATKEATNSLLKDTAIGMFENAVQESLTEPINEFVAQLTGGEDAADWSNMKERMIQAGTDGALLEFILGGVHAGVPSAQTIKGKIDSNIIQNQAPLKGITTADITKMADDVSKVIDTEQIVKNQAEQTKAKLNDYLLSKGVESTSVIDKSKIIDEKLGTNLSEDVKKAVNSGKLDKNTYQELNNKLDQVVQAENTDDLYKHAERLDDILELKDTKQSLTGIVEKLSKENRLNDELSQNLKAAFTEIDNQMPYVAETSDNKKIDVFREDMMNFMNNSERAHNFAKSVESIIEKTGLNIRLNNELASDENGRIFNQNGETIIEINPNSESAGEFILMHELTHAIGNQDLKQTILDYANKNKEFKTALKDFEARYGQTDITEEVMADISGQLLGNEEFINSLAHEQPSKFKQIYNAVKSWVKKFTGTYGYEDFVRDVETKWRKAYEQNKNSITENIDQKILNNKTTLEEIPLFSKNEKWENKAKYVENNNIKNYDILKEKLGEDKATEISDLLEKITKMRHEIHSSDSLFNMESSDYDNQSKFIDEINEELNNNGLKSISNLPNTEDIVSDIDYYEIHNYDSYEEAYDDFIKDKERINTAIENWLNEFDKEYGTHYSPTGFARLGISDSESKETKDSLFSKSSNNNIIEESENNSDFFNLQKNKQLDIIKNNNPMHDEYHTGIRKLEDIKTLQEAIEDSDYKDNDSYTPDLTKKDIENAIQKGKITVYSSYPIEQGVFVSPSKMEAQNYAGNNQIYSKEVNINDVAWIDPLEGQYAQTDTQTKLPKEDNQGRTLTKEQQEYFKDSKVRDENGNLLEVYHGTEANAGIPKEYWFTIFDIDKASNHASTMGDGFYFTDDYERASTYAHTKGNVYKSYLNITNPFIKPDNFTFREAVEEINPNYDINQLYMPNSNRFDGTKLRQYLIDNGYDGISLQGTYVAFYPQQIKNVDNTNPTNNPDIRYSKQSDKWQEWLEKNFPSRGTTTKFSDILLPNANIQNNNTQTNIKPASDSVINKIEQGLKDIYPVDLDNEQLKEIATNIANNPTEKGILEALKDYRTAYLEDETADNEIINEIKSTIRNTKLDVSNLKNSITDYNDLRKANFGKLKLGNDGSKIDTFYQELSSTYPDYFDSEISNEADQLDAIIDFINEDQATKTEYQMTDEDIINSGLIDAVTTALNTEQTETIKETPKEAVKETTENDLIKRNKELYKQRYNLEKEAQRLDRKIELTDNEKGIVKSLLNGDITIDEIPTRYAEHKDSIIQKYQNDKALNEVRNEIKKNKEQSKSVYNTTADEVVKNLSKFKDKSKGILYRRETAIRNIQDVVKDKVLADKINNTYFKPVLENEAARTRYINDNMQKINDLKIDTKKTYPYSNPMVDKNGKKYMENLKINEADIAGLYLEKKISDDYLTKNHIDKARIEKIADTFKSILDDGINNMETEVMKAGYAPIGRIENYFPHFMETRPDGLIGKISNFIGIRTKVKSLPTEIAGKTDTFRPGKTWNQNALHREGDITDINALKAMENYINGASDVIYHTDDIQKLRALERSIRESYSDEATKKTINNILKDSELTFDEKEEAIYNKLQNVKTEIPNFVTWLTEYTNILANKKSQSDRSMEYNWGRQTYTTMQDIESKIASNMIGGNLSVSLTNFAPLSQAMGTTKVGNVLIGMLETTQNTIKNVFGNGDNFVDSSDFLTRRRGTETIHKLKASEKLSNVLGKPMEIIDNFTSEAIVRAKYRENIQNGMTEMEALKSADEYTANLMADRSKGALPTLFNSKNPISKLVTMFQVEPNNMLSNYTKDWRNYNGNKAVAIAKLTVASYAFNTILKSLRGGSDILPDPINIVSQLIKMMTSDDDEEKKKAQDELISSITGSIPFGTSAVVLGQALGIDMPDSVQNSGRMPIASAIPNWKNIVNGAKSDSPEYRNQQFYKEFMKPLLYLGLPTGGAQINKTIEGLKAYEKGGSYKYNSKGEKLLQFPVKQNMTNLIKSATFGKYSTPEGQEYATNFDAFNAKQTKLYDETDIDYKDLKKYYKDTKGQKDLAKMQYVDNMDISDDDKVELYKSDILSEKQAENLDYALDHKITTKKTFDNEYQKLQEKNISLPTKEDYQMMNSADISLKNYSDYKVATKGLKTEAEKNKALRNLSCSSKTKQAIYENTTGKDDETYQSVKNVISINNYLDYKSQKFVADKDENGKTISGSRKQKLIDYLNSNRNMNYQEKLIILGMNNKLSSGELTVVFNYVNSQKLTAKQKIAILKKVKGFKINGNNISW